MAVFKGEGAGWHAVASNANDRMASMVFVFRRQGFRNRPSFAFNPPWKQDIGYNSDNRSANYLLHKVSFFFPRRMSMTPDATGLTLQAASVSTGRSPPRTPQTPPLPRSQLLSRLIGRGSLRRGNLRLPSCKCRSLLGTAYRRGDG